MEQSSPYTEVCKEKIPVLSAEIFIIPLETDSFIIYAPLRRSAFVGNKRIVNFLANLKNGIYDASADEDGSLSIFLRKLRIVDAGEEELPITAFTGIPEPTAISLFLTTACNLRCSYCYASAGDHKPTFMPPEVARQGIDFIITNAIKYDEEVIEINYHGGGEPMLHERVMFDSLAYARQEAGKYGLKVIASTATNGVLNDSQIEKVITHLQGVSVSFDGLPEAHDTYRVTPSGKGSSEQVIHTLRKFDEAGFNYGIRVTVTADRIYQMADSVEFICSNFKPKRIMVEPAYQIGRWADAPSSETEAFINGFRKARKRAEKYGHALDFSGARAGLLSNHFCGISQDTFALTVNGYVSACYEVFSEENQWSKVFIYGKAETGKGYQFDMERLTFLRNQAVQHREYCNGCFAKWSCAGDCYHKALTVTKTLEFTGTDRCNIIRELTKDQLLSYISNSGNMCWTG